MAKVDLSDSNSILSNVLIIIVVIGIAYLIYYMYTSSNKQATESRPVQEGFNAQQVHRQENRQENRHEQRQDQRHEQHQNGDLKNVRHQMNGKAGGLENPVMNKQNTLPKGHLTGQNKMEHFSADPQYQVERNLTSFPKDQLTAQELLPQDNSSLWAQVNPSGEGSLKDRSFLQAGYNIGINTVGQTLRNANLQLRSEPPCPQVAVSPWIQSTIEPDVSRKPFEIGGCA